MTPTPRVGARLRGATVLRRARRFTSAPLWATSTVIGLQRFEADPLARLELTIAALADAALADVLLGGHDWSDGDSAATGGQPSAGAISPPRGTDHARAPINGRAPSAPGGGTGPSARSAPVQRLPGQGRSGGSRRDQPVSGGAVGPSLNRPAASVEAHRLVENCSAGTATPNLAWTSRVVAAAASMPIRRAADAAPPTGAHRDASPWISATESNRSTFGPGEAGDTGGPAAPHPSTRPSGTRGVGAAVASPDGAGAAELRRTTASAPTQLASLARWWNDTHGPDEPTRAGEASAVTPAQSPGSPPVPPGTSTTAASAGGPNASGPSSDLATSTSALDRASFADSVSHLDELRLAFGGLLEDVLLSEARADGIEVQR